MYKFKSQFRGLINTFISAVSNFFYNLFTYLQNNDKARKITLRSSVLVTLIGLLLVFIVPTTSGAYSSTWEQTQWNNGVGASTTNQYSSATGIDTSKSGEFSLQNNQSAQNSSFDSNLDNWTTGNSEIVPTIVATSVKPAVTSTSHALTLSSEPQEGNLLVAALSFASNPGTISPPSGWVLDESKINPNSLGVVQFYHKVVVANEQMVVTFNNTISDITNYTITELTGVDLANPVDVTSTYSGDNLNMTDIAIPQTPLTTRKNSIAIARVGYDSTSNVTAWSNNFISADVTNSYGYTGYLEINSKQQVSTTFSGNLARRTVGAIVVYKGALTSQQNVVLPGVVQSRNYTSETSPSMTLNSQPQVGNILVAAISYTGGPSIVIPPEGWVLDTSIVDSTRPRVDIYHKVVEAGDSPSINFFNNGYVSTFTLHEFSGVDVNDLVDQVSSFGSGATSSTTASIPATAETNSSKSIAIARISMNNTSAFTSFSNGFSETSSTINYGYSATKVLNSKQQVSTTFTGVTSRLNAGAIVVYKAAPGSTPSEVQNKTYTYGVTTAMVAKFTQPIREGNTLFATFMTRLNPGTITPPPGWSQIAVGQSPSGRSTLLYSKVVEKNEELTQFFNAEYSLAGTVNIYEVRGLAINNSVDKMTTFANMNSNPFALSLATTTQDREFILGAISTNSTNGFPISWINNDFNLMPGSIASEFQSGFKYQTNASAYNLSFSNASARILQGYLGSFKTAGAYVDANRDTSIKYSGTASVNVTSSPWANAVFTQSINVGDSETYKVSAIVHTDVGVVDSNIAQLYYGDSAIATTYEQLSNGWYKLSAVLVGETVPKNIGVQVLPNQSVNFDDINVSRFTNTGTLTSNIFDTGRLSNWGNLTFEKSGNGNVTVKARSSNDANMIGAPNFSTCSAIATGTDISSGTNGCVTDAEQYIQYQVILDRGTDATPVFENVEIEYVGSDEVAPDNNASNISMFKSNGGDSVPLNGWTNGNTPYFTWDSGSDNAGGIGIAGYCIYLGSDSTADPVTTKGMLGTGDLDTRNACPFATADEHIDLSAVDKLVSQFTSSNDAYYINIKAIDGNDNIFNGSSESFHFRFDNTAPTNPAYINAPSNFIASKTLTMSWPTITGSAPQDNISGVAGLQYKIGGSGTWYGDYHSGSQDFSDLLSNDGEYTTQPIPDFDDLIEGSNVIYFRTWDNAGNVSVGSVTTVLKINTAGAPSEPQDVSATPSTNTQNSFAFQWLAPQTYVGNVNNLTYCYTINVTPTVNNCTFTASNALSLSAGPYATQPGANTIYVVAKDESGSINYDSYGSAQFTANTAAPGIPLNTDIADTSVRSTSNWRLVISWEPPSDVGAGVNSYEVYRSVDNANWSKAGNTGGTSYVDTELEQTKYYYKIRACDSANNCGAFSSTSEQTPTGRFTTPAKITSTGGAPIVSNIQTRSVDISWSTDRNSDSKVAFGIAPGAYGATEAYKSQQTTDHKITLDNLTPGQTYYFVVRWTDTDGNTGTTSELVFVTLPPPTVQDVNAIGISLNGATIQYTTTGATSIKIYYGQTNGFGAVIDTPVSTATSTYLAQLKDLQDGTKYYYKVNSFDASGFEYQGTTISFDTPPAPKISNLRFQPVDGEKSSTQLVTWDTNVASTSELSYGVEGGETLTTLDTSLTTTHEVKIDKLIDDSTYRLVARSRDASSNLATSDSQTFKTALDTRPPKVTDVNVVSSIRGTGTESRGQIIVSWKTDEPSTSQVSYGEGASGDLSNSSAQDGRLTLDHAVVISDLSTSKVYSIQAISLDKGDNKATSDRQSAIIGRGTESALGIIFSVLQKIFGVGI